MCTRPLGQAVPARAGQGRRTRAGTGVPHRHLTRPARPAPPVPRSAKAQPYIASMGIYVCKANTLRELLENKFRCGAGWACRLVWLCSTATAARCATDSIPAASHLPSPPLTPHLHLYLQPAARLWLRHHPRRQGAWVQGAGAPVPGERAGVVGVSGGG